MSLLKVEVMEARAACGEAAVGEDDRARGGGIVFGIIEQLGACREVTRLKC